MSRSILSRFHIALFHSGVWLATLGITVASEVKFVTEYRYPTSYQVTPVVGTDPNGNARILGGIVTPQDFETREVGVAMAVYAVVGRIGGVDAVADGAQLINGNTDLMVAATAGDYRAAAKALEKGTAVNARNRFGSTALMGACAGGFEKIVRLLIDGNAEVNAKSSAGQTALLAAARNGHASIVQTLLKHGAEVNVTDGEGSTPLAAATSGGQAGIVKLLLQNGANAAMPDKHGNTPISLAKAMENRDIVILLTQPASEK